MTGKTFFLTAKGLGADTHASSPLMPQLRYKASFTLVELLIVTAIIGLLGLSLVSAFQTGILSYKKLDSAFEVYQGARIILQRIELDLKNAFAYRDEQTQFKGEPEELDFFSVVDTYQGPALLRRVCRISYRLNQEVLGRACYQGLDALKEEAEKKEEVLASNVKKVTFEYAYRTGVVENPYEWATVWPKDASQENSLPVAVKIKLSLIENAKQDKNSIVEFEKVVAMPLAD
jgi:type II secretory pathway component PulJ